MDERIGSTPPPIAPAAARAARQTVHAIAGHAIPALADFVVVFVVARRTLVGIASAHIHPDGDRILRALQRVYRVRLGDLHSTVAQALRTGRPSIRSGITLERKREVRRGSVADLHRRLGTRSALVVPIKSARRVLGAVTLCYAESGRAYSRGDMPAARRLAEAIAQAIAPDLAHAASRLRAPAGDARARAAVRRRVDSRD